MPKKLKDYYDANYLEFLTSKISSIYPDFQKEDFQHTILRDGLEQLEFKERQILIAQHLNHFLPFDYKRNLELFLGLLGPELDTSVGMFTEGYWLWPIGTYVELYGESDMEATLSFSRELTKRHTAEFALRPLVIQHSEKIFSLMKVWSVDSDSKIRRLASEILRINLPWARKSLACLSHFDDYQIILSNLRNDMDKSVQKSVANNLNDLSKTAPDLFYRIRDNWLKDPNPTPQCLWILKYGSRTLRKKAISSFTH